MVDGTLYVTDARQRVGARRARRPRAVALLLEDARRHAHRQPRPRHVARLALHGDARQLPRLARREDGQGALAQGHRRLQPAVLLDDGADRHRQPRDRRHGQRPRLAGIPAVVRSRDRRAAVEALHGADESRRSGPRHVAEPRSRAARRRRSRGCPASTIRRRSCTSSAPATRSPAYTAGRGEGDNLFTCSLIAVNVDTGKMAWYFQTSPHDMHDWDSAQTPILIDAVINGKPRKLVSTAARNGYFFTLDRVTGEHIVTSEVRHRRPTGSRSIDEQRIAPPRSREGRRRAGGAIVSPTAGGTINWEPPAYSPDTGLVLRRRSTTAISIFYLTDPDPRGSMGLGGQRRGRASASGGSFLTAIDYRPARSAWRRPYPGCWRRRWRRHAHDGGQAGVRRRRRRQHRRATTRRPARRCGTRTSAT